MQIKELQKLILDKKLYNQFNNKLVFLEDDEYLEKLIINLIANTYQCEVHYEIDFTDIVNDLSATGLFATNSIYILRNPSYFMKKPEELLKLKISTNNILILIYNTVDTKSKFYELLNKDIVYFPKLNKEQFESIIQKNYPLNSSNIKKLLEITDSNSLRVFSELNKIDILSKTNNRDINEIFEESIANGLIYKDNTKEYSDWVDAIIKKDFVEAINCANKISKIDDDTMRLINMLHETYKSFLISPPTRIKFSKEELINNIDFVHSCEMGIKNGFIEEEFVRNYLMINLILN